MKKKLYYLIFLCFFATLPAGAQKLNISYPEKLEIKNRAKLKIEEFEQLLNQIADQSRNRTHYDDVILSSYTDGKKFKKVFYNDSVRIEEDINPNASAKEGPSVSDVTVDTYLARFNLLYNKQPEKTVFFDSLVFSDVLQDDFPYIVVSYDSHFKGTHSELKSQPYLPQKRRATLRAEYNKENGRWQLWITGVNFAQGPPPPLLSLLLQLKNHLNHRQLKNHLNHRSLSRLYHLCSSQAAFRLASRRAGHWSWTGTIPLKMLNSWFTKGINVLPLFRIS